VDVVVDRAELRRRDLIVEGIRRAMIQGGSGLRELPGLMTALIEQGMWRERESERLKGRIIRFQTFQAFLRTEPTKGGMYADIEELRKMLRDDPKALDVFDQALQRPPGGDQRSAERIIVSNRNDDRPAGTTRQYALRKLRKDRPDLHRRVLDGELSPHAGMVLAGFRKKPEPLDQLRRAWKRASPGERELFLSEVRKEPVPWS
jgi:hypothetical protein